MPTRRRRALTVVVGLMVLVVAACGAGDSSDSANPVPSLAEASPSPSADGARAEGTSAEGTDATAAESASTVVPAGGSGQQSATEQTARYETIHDVDFFNDFSYATSFGDGDRTVTVTDGSFENGAFGDDEYFWFGATDIAYGDLDNDGLDDAVVHTTWNGGGTGYFDSVIAFRLVEGQVQAMPNVSFGDRADGGINALTIAGGYVYVWAFAGGDGACCPNTIAKHTLVLGPHALVKAEVSDRWSWMSVHEGLDSDELTFLPGTSEGIVTLYPTEQVAKVRFDAGQDQRVTISTVGGPEPVAISLHRLDSGAEVSPLRSSDDSFLLPTNGLYEIRVQPGQSAHASTMLLVGIDAVTAPPVTWTPVVDQALLDDDPFVHTSVTWPQFASSQPGTQAANAALATFATALDDQWVADVIEYEDPLDDSTYDAGYTVTYASEQIVAVRFDFYDYVCCRPYPNYGPRAAVLDLTAGRLLGFDDILDTQRLADVQQLWLDKLEAQDLVVAGDITDVTTLRIDSLTLVADGIELGTERGALGGGSPGTLTTLTFDELGDLVRASLRGRLG